MDVEVVRRAVKNLILSGADYREEVVGIIDAEFIRFALNFFKEVAAAKIENHTIGVDWYQRVFMDAELRAGDIALHAGINMKTITNMHGTAKKTVVIDAAQRHYESLLRLVEDLTRGDDAFDFVIAIKMGGVSIDLNIRESLVVINALAVKRAAMRGGAWSAIGKRVEKPLMETLCRLYSVDGRNWDAVQIRGDGQATFEREVDFFLVDEAGVRHKCEVKLMGKGNPESADAVIARDSRVFVADTLSDTNKAQLDSRGVLWVALKERDGYRRFARVLQALGIGYAAPAPADVEALVTAALRSYA